ncbi:MAG: hypothetical protein PHT36_02375, partial [Patescibacteria group bacterium]|nr:hypothetical protein [Patescibacteria group bacterium]
MIKRQLFFKVVFFVLFAALSWPQGIHAETKATSQSFKYKDTENDIIFEAKITEGEYTTNKNISFK